MSGLLTQEESLRQPAKGPAQRALTVRRALGPSASWFLESTGQELKVKLKASWAGGAGATVVPGPSECCEWGDGMTREGWGVQGKEASTGDSDGGTGQRWPDLWQTPPKSSSGEAKAQPSTGPGLGLSEEPIDIEPL